MPQWLAFVNSSGQQLANDFFFPFSFGDEFSIVLPSSGTHYVVIQEAGDLGAYAFSIAKGL